MRGRPPRWRWVVAGGAALLAVAGFAAAVAWKHLFDSMLASQLALVPNTRSFNSWVEPDVPLYFEVFLYNWTNADMFPSEKPNLEQLGPYRFLEKRKHVNVSWHQNNATLGYRIQHSWHFDDASNGTLEDSVTTLNAVAASAVYRSRFWGFLQQKGLSMGLAVFGQQISVSKTAGELLFDGYEDSLLDFAKTLPPSATDGAPQVDRFGWFFERNNSLNSDGYMEVTTGERGGTLPGQIVKWNHNYRLPYYSGSCAELSGTAGEFMPRNLTEESEILLFSPDLCRTVVMDYMESSVYEGLQYHKYGISPRSFDNSSFSSANTCFCNGACEWSGIMNVSACRYGSPAFISLPHFLYGDPRLRDLVTGMEPDPDKHSFYFAVEPRLGIPLDVAARFQLNMYIESNPYIALYEHVPKMLFPILWVQQRVLVDDTVVTELLVVRRILEWGGTVCSGIALTFAIIATVATCYNKKSKYKKKCELLKTREKLKDDAELKLNSM
ncbi:protein peste-like [Achroia grisella]|uniref:protein peste-like n=1 Tax=Achroia grisella TaxID=688607 RepID=UPI0027D2EFF2|nr:protein peste-like [Achroia grisella]